MADSSRPSTTCKYAYYKILLIITLALIASYNPEQQSLGP